MTLNCRALAAEFVSGNIGPEYNKFFDWALAELSVALQNPTNLALWQQNNKHAVFRQVFRHAFKDEFLVEYFTNKFAISF